MHEEEEDGLTILPVMEDPDAVQFRDVDPRLLKPPFRIAIVGASKSGKCLDPSGKVLTLEGEKQLKDVKIGNLVYTKEGYVHVLDVIDNGMKEVYDVFFTDGYQLTCTEDHKIDTLEGLKAVKDLSSSDKVISKKGIVKLVGYNNPRMMSTMDLEVNNISHTFFYDNISVSNSNYLMNYFRPSFYGGSKKKGIEPCFNKLLIFSPNFGMDETTKSIRELCDESDIHITYDDSIIQNLIDSQKARESDPNRDRVLIIADDLIGLGCKPNALIYSAVTYLRHLSTSICFLSQTLKGNGSLTTTVRNNLDGLIMFRCPSAHQTNALCEDLCGTFGTKQNVYNMLGYATQKPYHFCFFDYRNLRVFHNHTEFMWAKYKKDGSYNEEFDPGNIQSIEDME